MNCFHWLYIKVSIKLIMGIYMVFSFSGITAAIEPLEYTSEEVIARVNKTYQRVHSASGRITRTIEYDGNEPQSFNGRFAIQKPDRLLVVFIGDVHQFMGYDGKTLRIYFPEENRGFYTETQKLTPLERFVVGPGPYFGNILQIMEEGFSFKVADMVAGNLILKAIPLKPFQFNFILIAVDPKTWTIRAVENFDRKNKLVNQTRFLEFKTISDSLFFPVKVKTSNVFEEGFMAETMHLTRVQLNVSLDTDAFRIPFNDDTEWVAQPIGKHP